MNDNHISNLSITPSVGRQTQHTEFGEHLKNALKGAAAMGGTVSGAIVGALPGGAIVSAAVSSVSNFASQGGQAAVRSAAGSVGGLAGASTTNSAIGSVGDSGIPGGSPMPTNFGDMITQMRAEADKSIVQQMQMQQESREYNTLTNVLKVRHDSAKAAINNIR